MTIRCRDALAFLQGKGVDQGMKANGQDSAPADIAFATHEARELRRIRTSFSFRIGVELIRTMKNPFRIFGLPIRVSKMVFRSNKSEIPLPSPRRSGIFVIGIDKSEKSYSRQAEYLARKISESSSRPVTLFTTGVSSEIQHTDIEWYRAPCARSDRLSRRSWNIMIERLLSSALCISEPNQVVFFGDYMYRGVADALKPIENEVSVVWLPSMTKRQRSYDTKDLEKIHTIHIPEFVGSDISSFSVHRSLERSESERVILLDICSEKFHLINSHGLFSDCGVITAVQGDSQLPKGVDFVVNPADVFGVSLEGNICVILDDQSAMLDSIAVLGAPCLLLRSGRTLSPIVEEMVRDMELSGGLVVVRRNSRENLIESVKYLFGLQDAAFANQQTTLGEKLGYVDYFLIWLNRLNQS